MSILVDVTDVRKEFETGRGLARGRQRVVAVDGVTFSIAEGETLGLVGESGSGKSTLARILVGLYTPSAGTVRVAGRQLHGRGRNRNTQDLAAGALQMVFQEPRSSLNPRLRIGASIAEPCRAADGASALSRAHRGQTRGRVIEMLDRVGLDAATAERYPHELSGGQQQRACIARALIARPKLVVFDEAISSLDASHQTRVIELIADLRTEFQATYLFITHDLRRAAQVSDRIAIMYAGKIVEILPNSELEQSAHPYTQALVSAALTADPTMRGQFQARLRTENTLAPTNETGCRFENRCPYGQDVCRAEEPPLRVHRPGHSVACHFAEQLASPELHASPLDAEVHSR